MIAIVGFACLATTVRVAAQMHPEAPAVPTVPPIDEDPDAPREVIPAPEVPDKMAIPAPTVTDRMRKIPPKAPAMGSGGNRTIPKKERKEVTPTIAH
ncbi:MAG: hypothetical protein ACREQ9_00165 [Candidatus Binatia bacterium]